MKISLVDVDGHHFPNLALMKIAAWHKAQGDSVDWYAPLFSHPEKIYASKVFTFSRDFVDYAPNDPEPTRGGTGYNVMSKLPDEIENTLPDYSIYPRFSEAYGFLTRGCIRNCSWCVVPRKEGDLRIVEDIERISAGRKHVVLMDNNFLAAPADFIEEQCEKMKRCSLRVDFNQGLDARLVTTANAKLLAGIRYIRHVRFSCDRSDMIQHIRRAIALLRESGLRQEIFCYMLVTDDLEDAESRARELVRMGVTPFAQPFRNLTTNQEPSPRQRDFARFVNVKGGKLVLKMKFADYHRTPKRERNR